jgi:hypothetical protein
LLRTHVESSINAKCIATTLQQGITIVICSKRIQGLNTKPLLYPDIHDSAAHASLLLLKFIVWALSGQQNQQQQHHKQRHWLNTLSHYVATSHPRAARSLITSHKYRQKYRQTCAPACLSSGAFMEQPQS